MRALGRVDPANARRFVISVIAVTLWCSSLAGAAPLSSAPPGRIVYSKSVGDGRYALFVSRADGSGAVQITAGPADYNAQWSPDGRRIVFERSVAEDETAVWIVNADGTRARRLDSGPFAEHPRWSPDGRWIAYQVQTSENIVDGLRANTTFELWLVRSSGSVWPRLLDDGEPPLEDDNPRFYVESGAWAWSPDSRHIAFVRPLHDWTEEDGVQIVDIATGRTRYLGRGADVAWSPDGHRLAVTVTGASSIGEPECGVVWIVTLDGARGVASLVLRVAISGLGGLQTDARSSSRDPGSGTS